MVRRKIDDGALRIGAKLKHARRLKGMRLIDVARRIDCSESLLSKIENNKATPSLSLLHRLCTVLETNIAWLFTAKDETPSIVLRKAERPVFEFDNFRQTEDTEVERVAPYYDGQMLQALLFVIGPGGHSLDVIRHEGEEVGYVLAGRLDLTVDGQTYHLETGDAFQFRSDRPHGYRNPGTETTRVLWINTPPTY
ncbi:MAG: cupin domain-containing protein [Alphaproteobacteria bacterium]|nr:cupin domain-containing protein [Alphaproteobacteria bacterium]